MAKGIIRTLPTRRQQQQKPRSAPAAATVVVQNVAGSITKKNGVSIPPSTSDKPMLEFEMAVQQLLAPQKPWERPRACAEESTIGQEAQGESQKYSAVRTSNGGEARPSRLPHADSCVPSR